jgi:hypothetical protein
MTDIQEAKDSIVIIETFLEHIDLPMVRMQLYDTLGGGYMYLASKTKGEERITNIQKSLNAFNAVENIKMEL